jgi:hypothetical protein
MASSREFFVNSRRLVLAILTSIRHKNKRPIITPAAWNEKRIERKATRVSGSM